MPHASPRLALAALLLLLPSLSSAQVLTKPAPGSFSLRADLVGQHPRLHFTAKQIPALRARGASFFVTRMKEAYGGYKDKPVKVSGTSDWKNYLYGLWGQLSMNMLWIVEQDPGYADTAKSWALHYVRDESWCAADKDLDNLIAQEIVTGIALTYDIQFDRLTPAERAEIRAKLKLLLDRQYERFFVGQYWTNDLQNNHMHNRISGLGHAAIAILGDDPAMDVQRHADLAHHAYQQMRAWMPEDGSTHEGPGYWDYGFHWVVRDEQLFAHTTGVTPPASGHDRQTPYYRLYMLTPGQLSTFRVGDTGSAGPAKNLEAMLPAIARFRDPRLHGFIARQMKDNAGGFYQQLGFGLLWYDPTVGQRPVSELPLHHVWPDLDVVSVRSGWQTDDLGAIFSCGPPGGHAMQQRKLAGETSYINVAHDHPDQNSLVLWAHGEMLATDDGYPKDQKLTSAHNTLLIGGAGGPKEGTGWYQPFPYDQTASMRQVALVGGKTAYAAGDASRLYTHGERFIRHFAFVEGEYVLLIDDVKAKGPTPRELDWRLHSAGDWSKLGPTRFVLAQGQAGLEVRVLGPGAGKLSSNFFAAAGKAHPGLSVRTTASEARFITALLPHRAGEPPEATTELAPATKGWAVRVTTKGGATVDRFAVAAGADGATIDGATVDELELRAEAMLLRTAESGSTIQLALLAGGTELRRAGQLVLSSDRPANLAWRPSKQGGALEAALPYKAEPTDAARAISVGGLDAGARYCLAIDGVAAGGVTADDDGVAKLATTLDGPRSIHLTRDSEDSCADAPGDSGQQSGAGDPPPPEPDAGPASGSSAPGALTVSGTDSDAEQRLSSGCAAAGEAPVMPWLLIGLYLVLLGHRRRA